jgi:hypothetical protein
MERTPVPYPPEPNLINTLWIFFARTGFLAESDESDELDFLGLGPQTTFGVGYGSGMERAATSNPDRTRCSLRETDRGPWLLPAVARPGSRQGPRLVLATAAAAGETASAFWHPSTHAITERTIRPTDKSTDQLTGGMDHIRQKMIHRVQIGGMDRGMDRGMDCLGRS